MAEFNLIDKEWIPCINADGRRAEYGIHDTLLKAHELREICDDSPLVTVAIHRLLLAILYRANNGPTDLAQWKTLWNRGAFDDKRVADYLNKWQDRFFVLDDTHPFMQVSGLDLNEYGKNGKVKKDKSDGLMRLAREAPDKGGRVLFDHRVGTERPEYAPKQIVKMILAAQSYAGTGIASGGQLGDMAIKPTPCQFAPCVDGLCLWLQGENLYRTLMLNLVPINLSPNDLPAWEDQGIATTAVNSWTHPIGFAGPIQRFASLSRFIRVLDRKSMFYTNGLKINADNNDPMKAYSRPDDAGDFLAVKLHENKAAWRDAHTLFSLNSATIKPPASLNHIARLFGNGTVSKSSCPRANVVGLATDQGKSLLWRHDRMPVPLDILGSTDLTERLRLLISQSEMVGAELSQGLFWSATTKKTIRKEPVGRIQSVADLILMPSLELRECGVLRTSSGRAPNDAHNKSALDLSESLDPRPAYWARLETHSFELLANLANDFDAIASDWKPNEQQTATRSWREHVKREAKQALEESLRSLGMTGRAIQAIARVRTDFNDDDLKRPAPNTPKGKRKGGKKQ